jgi:hypothetical protein
MPRLSRFTGPEIFLDVNILLYISLLTRNLASPVINSFRALKSG